MRLLQTNLHRSRAADALLKQIAVERGIDAVIISEQYGRIARGSWFEDETGTTALSIPGSGRFAVTEHGAYSGYPYISSNRIYIYLTPSDDIEQFKTNVVFKLQEKQRKLLYFKLFKVA